MKVYKPLRYSVTCHKCATIINFQLDEAITIDEYSYFDKYIICPTCNLKLRVQKTRWQDCNVELEPYVTPIYETKLSLNTGD